MDRIPAFLLTDEPRKLTAAGEKKFSFSFIDRTLRNVCRFIGTGYQQAGSSTQRGFLQILDARVKIVLLVSYALLISVVHKVPNLICIFALILLLYLFSAISLRMVYKKVFVYSFFFGFLVFVPAALNIITPGKIVFTLLQMESDKQFWIYHIPAQIGITYEGIGVVVRLYLKVVNSIALALLVLYTTPFEGIVKALKVFRVPDMFLLIITLTYKFIFILSHTVEETFFALKLRWWGKIKKLDADNIVAGRVAYIFRKSWHRYEEIYRAMVARGFSGKVNLYYLQKFRIWDFVAILVFLAIGLWVGFILNINW